jgi:hypothetical protein
LLFLLTDHGDFWQNAARGYSLRRLRANWTWMR